MPDLPQNKTYSKENVASMVGAMKNVGQSIKQHYKTKRVSTAPYQGIANQVQSYAPASADSVPASLNSLGKISTPYGGSTKIEQFHPGLDIANTQGTKIPSFSGGTVVETRTGQGWTPNTPSYGNYVIIKDDKNNTWRYSHLEKNYVKIGDVLKKGDVLGTMGGTGSTYSVANPGQPGYHLDLRIRDSYNKYVNPQNMIY